MFYFIDLLRALAAFLITNAHYTNIYPVSILANGGLLGDMLFFSVSGYCLYNIKLSFIEWYKKRIVRIYPSLWIISIVYTVIGFYYITYINSIFQIFIYPTKYHFVSSIMILYIVYFIVIKLKQKYKFITINYLIIFVAIIQLLVYIVAYDRTFYHIDTVYEPMIRFLFLQAMLIGAKFNEEKNKYMNKSSKSIVGVVILFVMYFILKICFVKFKAISNWQIINQYIILTLLFFIFKLFISKEQKLKNINIKAWNIVKFISSITLEIYLVQYEIIPRLEYFIFPINFIIVTTTIVLSAYLVWIAKEKIFRRII